MKSATSEFCTGRESAALNRLLAVSGLSVDYREKDAWKTVVHQVSFTLHRGETIGLVGESGSGKSTVAHAILGLLNARASRSRGSVTHNGSDLIGLKDKQLRQIRGRKIAFIGQNAMGGLNPLVKVGTQIAEPLRIHRGMSKSASNARALELMELVQIPAASQRLNEYPHQLSGGMKQRVGIAMALAVDPEILIADEPTTALDVTVQAHILRMLKEYCAQREMSMIFVSHDLSAIARVADTILVMYAGRVVERGPVAEVMSSPAHPYSQGLIAATPAVQVRGKTRPTPIPGNPADPAEVFLNCPFESRCSYSTEQCLSAVPELVRVGGNQRFAACYHPLPHQPTHGGIGG